MKRNILNFFKSLLVTFAFSFSIYSYYLKDYANLFGIHYIFIVFILCLLFILFSNDSDRSNKYINFLSIIFSLFYIFGYSYMNISNSNLVFGRFDLFLLSFISAIGYFIIFTYIIKKIFKLLDSKFLFKNIKIGRFINIFEEHPFIFSIIFIIVCWLPYIIAFYPAILSPDPSFQIKQFFGIWSKYNEYSVMVDPNVLITNHHPVVHTLLLGSCLKLGNIFGNDNFGLFICSMIQILFLSGTFSYSISYLKKISISNKIRFIVLLIYAFVPMFPLYSMSLVKDVIFTCFVMLFVIYLHKLIRNKKFNYFVFLLIMLGMFLFRNNGYHVLVFTFIFMLFLLRKKWKFILGNLFIVIAFSTCYNNVILPYFHITPGSVREVLSVPFQQTARYYRDHKSDLSSSDMEIIDKILDVSDLDTRYDEEISDPVKNKFNKFATDDDLNKYFEVWFNGLLKHPTTYIDATVNNVYGYFYPEKTSWYVYYKFNSIIVDDGFNYHYNSLSGLRSVLSGFAVSYPYIPIIGMLSNIGFCVWFIMIMSAYLIYKKKGYFITLFLPSFGLILVCILSPVNCYFRYAMPYVFQIPFLFGLFIDLIKGDSINEECR